DRRAPTPTAAAEIVVPRLAELQALVARGERALVAALRRRHARDRRHLDQLVGRLRDPRRRIAELRARNEALARRLGAAMARRVALARARADAGAHRLAVQH